MIDSVKFSLVSSPGLLIHFTLLLLAGMTLGVGCTVAPPPAGQPVDAPADNRPNILLFLFDDAGYSDLSAFGGEIETPTIERIVREGATVQRFYTAARCSPTRAGILTGKHPHSVGMADLANGRKYETPLDAYRGLLPPGIPLIPELLQAAGYKTYMEGKWHLGRVPGTDAQAATGSAPNLRGFDDFVGFLGGQGQPMPGPSSMHPYQHNSKPLALAAGWFSIDGLNAKTLELLTGQLDAEPGNPFFLYVASQSPHDPLGAPDKAVQKYRDVYAQPVERLWERRLQRLRELGLFPAHAPAARRQLTPNEEREFRRAAPVRAAMIEASDRALGRLLDLLESRGELDNTLVVVASDNGASTATSAITNAPFKGAKGNLWEGGTLSPMAVRWPAGNIEAGMLSTTATSYLDLMPTFLAAADVPYPSSWRATQPLSQPRGRNLLPLLKGKQLPPPENLYWNLYGNFAVLHQGRWKLISANYNEARERRGETPPLRLFDLQTDPAETRDLSLQEPELVEQLLRDYQAWARAHHAVPFFEVKDAYAAVREKIRQEHAEAFRAYEKSIKQRQAN